MGFFSHIAEWEKNPMGKIKLVNWAVQFFVCNMYGTK